MMSATPAGPVPKPAGPVPNTNNHIKALNMMSATPAGPVPKPAGPVPNTKNHIKALNMRKQSAELMHNADEITDITYDRNEHIENM